MSDEKIHKLEEKLENLNLNGSAAPLDKIRVLNDLAWELRYTDIKRAYRFGREAREMLEHLSGQTHCVYTGYAIVCKERKTLICDAVKTDVEFKHLSANEIAWYIQTGEPFDKAGAYAIQGMGTFLVRRINGSYTNVVGLPVCEVIENLLMLGVVSMSPDNSEGLGM